MSVTKAIATFAAETDYAAIPEDVRTIGRRIILDTIGNAVAGYRTSGSKLALRTVGQWGGSGVATVIATGMKTSPVFAAFANVGLACALEADETVANIGHIGHCALMPALALGEVADASGEALLTATILAYEAGARIGGAGRSVVRRADGKLDFGSTGVGSNWVIFPAAIGAARMLGLDTLRTCWSLGIAGTAASIPTGRRWNRPNWNHMKYNAYGLMAQSATQGAMLAANGYTGDPDIFDGEARDVKANWWSMAGFPAHDPEFVTNGLGVEWVMRETAFKPYPSCRFTHGLIDGMRAIVSRHQLSPDEIEAVETYTGRTLFVFKMQHPEVASEEDAQFSTPHVLGLAALGVQSGPDWVSPRWWTDPWLAAFKAKVSCHVSDEANALVIEQLVANRFEKFPWRIVVRARGQVFEEAGDYAAGDAFTPATAWGDAEIIAKFRAFTDGGLATATIDRCIETVMALGRTSSARDLTACLF